MPAAKPARWAAWPVLSAGAKKPTRSMSIHMPERSISGSGAPKYTIIFGRRTVIAPSMPMMAPDAPKEIEFG